MKEIKVRDYVRSIEGKIARVNEVDEHYIWFDKCIRTISGIPNYGIKKGTEKGYIAKHSSNIIDLIEVGDYVNGYKVYGISTEYLIDINKDGKILHIEKEGFINATITEGKDDIKSIVTKEQFENIEYRLEA